MLAPPPARIDNTWDGRMLQNAEGVSASPLLEDLGLRFGRQERLRRCCAIRFAHPGPPTRRSTARLIIEEAEISGRQSHRASSSSRAVKGGYVHPLRTPTFRDAMNGYSCSSTSSSTPCLDSRIRLSEVARRHRLL